MVSDKGGQLIVLTIQLASVGCSKTPETGGRRLEAVKNAGTTCGWAALTEQYKQGMLFVT